jgi:hypothetical protein
LILSEFTLTHRRRRRKQRQRTSTSGAFEAPGVEPVFPKKDQAIDYARNRACFRSGEIRVLDSSGNLERTIAFSEAVRKL